MNQKQTGFTIVELLIVIVVIGILTSIVIVAYTSVQTRARQSKMKSDISELNKAIVMAREVKQVPLKDITSSSYTAGSCVAKAAGTDLAKLLTTDACWVTYKTTLTRITNASGVDVNNIVDPWGRPYFIDENEGEGGGCLPDRLAVYAQPYNGSARFTPSVDVLVPLSGYSGCT